MSTYQDYLAQLQKEQAQRDKTIEENNRALLEQMRQNANELTASNAANEAKVQALQQQQQKDFADMALQYKRDFDAAVSEDERLRQEDAKRNSYMATTEALAALTNLIGVGALGSSNQTYKQYSRDWMQRADAERLRRQKRIDDMRDRQRVLQQQLSSIRNGSARDILSLQNQNAAQRYQMQNQLASAAANASNQLAAQKASDAAQNANVAIQQGNAERQFNEAVRARKEQETETRRNNNLDFIAAMARQGYVKDAYGNWIYSGKGSGGGNPNFSYDATIDGQYVRLDMNKNTFEQAVNDGRAELREDAARMAGYDSWKDMMSEYDRMSARKKTRKNIDPELQEFVSQLRKGSALADQNTISFVNEHRAELNNFNKHLLRVASSSVNNGMQAQTPVDPAENNAVEDKTGGAAEFFFGKRANIKK